METNQKGTGVIFEYWGLQALERCRDTLWPNAERGDVRYVPKKEALLLMNKNPGKFKHVGVWSYGGREWKKRRGED